MKKALSLLLAAALAVGLMTTGAFAAGTTETLTKDEATISLTNVLSHEEKTIVMNGDSKTITVYKIPKSGSTLTINWDFSNGPNAEWAVSIFAPGADGSYSFDLETGLYGGLDNGVVEINYEQLADKLTPNSLFWAGVMDLNVYFQFSDETASETSTPAVTPSTAAGDITYTVQYGDTLSAIAFNNYGYYSYGSRRYKANSAAFKETKGVLLAGMVLTLPEKLGKATRLAPQTLAEGESFYTVQAGDSLSKIALNTYGDMMKYKDIYQRNADRIKNANTIYVGQIIVLPAKTTEPMLAERG